MPIPLARKVEGIVHTTLKPKRTSKEWYTASKSEAVDLIERLLTEISLDSCKVGINDEVRVKKEVAVNLRLPAEVVEVFERLANTVHRTLPNFLRLTLVDAVTGNDRLLREVQERTDRTLAA